MPRFILLTTLLILSVLLGCPAVDDNVGDDDAGDDDVGDDDAGDDDLTDDDTGGDDDAAQGEWIGVDAGNEFTCGIHSDGTLECWGLADNGVMDEPSGVFTLVSSGWDHATALAEDGTVLSWGCFGETGIAACEAPTGDFVQVSSGFRHSCALGEDGAVKCWGDDEHGQAQAPAGSFTDVSAGDTHTCGVLVDGSVTCWGENHSCVTDAPTEGAFKQVSAGRYVSCALRDAGGVECWGCDFIDFDGTCDVPSGMYRSLGEADDRHVCAVRPNGTTVCWGAQDHGQSSPPPGEFQLASTGATHSCGVDVAGEMSCWGSDAHLQCSGGESNGSADGLEIPPASGVECEDMEPNDHDQSDEFPWLEAQECPGTVSAGGHTDWITGTLDPIVPSSWDGDTDTYHLVLQEDGYLTGSLTWDSVYTDLDWILYCYYEDEMNPENWYVLIPTELTASLSMPEEGQSMAPMTAGTECYAWVVGYDGPDGSAYELRLWMTYEDVQEQ